MHHNAVADSAMWDAATTDVDAANRRTAVVKATVALAGTWPFLAAAKSMEEFNHKLALVEEQIEARVPAEVRTEVVAGLREKFASLQEENLAHTAMVHTAARTIALAEGEGSLPQAYIHVHAHGSGDDEYHQVDFVGGPTFLQTIGRSDNVDEAISKAREYTVAHKLPLYQNGKYVEGKREPQLAPDQEFFDAKTGQWIKAATVISFRDNMPGMGNGWTADLQRPEDWRDGQWVPGSHQGVTAGLQTTAHQSWTPGGTGLHPAAGIADEAARARREANWGDSHSPRQATNYQPDPDAGIRYHYDYPQPNLAQGGQPTAPGSGSIDVAQQQGMSSIDPSDGFPMDVAQGEYAGAAAKMQQVLTPSPWVVTPGTAWPVKPNAGHAGQEQVFASRRTAVADHHRDQVKQGYEHAALWASTDDEGDPLDSKHEEVHPDAREAMHKDVDSFLDNHSADAHAHATKVGWGGVGHDLFLTRNHHGAGFWDRGTGAVGERLTHAAHSMGGDELYEGDDGAVHSSLENPHRRTSSRRTATEGAVPTPGANPNYFSQGTQGIAGPAQFPANPSGDIEPKTDNHIDEGMFDNPTPQMSSGSAQGQADGGGYTHQASLVLYPRGDSHVAVMFHGKDEFLVGEWSSKQAAVRELNDYARRYERAQRVAVRKTVSQGPPPFGRSAEERTAASNDPYGSYMRQRLREQPAFSDGTPKCPTCYGRGVVGEHEQMCGNCGGTGHDHHRTSGLNDTIQNALNHSSWSPDENDEHTHWQRGHYDASVGRNYAGEENQDDPKARAYRAGWDHAHSTNRVAARDDDDWMRPTDAQARADEAALGPQRTDEQILREHRRQGWQDARDGKDPLGETQFWTPEEHQHYLHGYGLGKDARAHHLAATNGQIVGHCDHCHRPVRYHDEGDGHLQHLHNSSPYCTDGKKSTAMRVVQGGIEYRLPLPKQGAVLEAPTPDNPTGRGGDDFRARTFDSLVKQRPMQSAEDRNANTPTLAPDPIKTGPNQNTPSPAGKQRERDDDDDEDDDDDDD